MFLHLHRAPEKGVEESPPLWFIIDMDFMKSAVSADFVELWRQNPAEHQSTRSEVKRYDHAQANPREASGNM
jgi:hypothetical protein